MNYGIRRLFLALREYLLSLPQYFLLVGRNDLVYSIRALNYLDKHGIIFFT